MYSFFKKGAPLATSPAVAAGGDKKRNPFRSIISGGITGAVEICINYPTEYLKTQMQLFDKGSNLTQTIKNTYKNYGVRGYYRGLTSLLYFSVPKVACRFFAFEYFKNKLADENGRMTPGKNTLAGLGAGVTEAIFVVTPMETIKTRMIHDQLSPNPKYKGFFHGCYSICKQYGMSGIYRGMVPTVIKQGSNQAIRFFTYNEVKKRMMVFHPGKPINPLETALAGAIAGAASVLGNTPIDVVKTRMQGLQGSQYKGTVDCIIKMAKNEGVKAFYKGTMARMMRVCLDVAITFVLYEELNKVMDRVWPEKKTQPKKAIEVPKTAVVESLPKTEAK